jgi:hypothetical protein
LDIKRLNQIRANPTPSVSDVVEITSENILTTSKHSKDIKSMLESIMESLADISSRLSSLEAKNSNIFQIEINDDSPKEQADEENTLDEDDEDTDAFEES